MAGVFPRLELGRSIKAIVFASVLGVAAVTGSFNNAQARGPESLADLAEELGDAVVNISTAQRVKAKRSLQLPDVPEGSPFQEFFEEFFNGQEPEGESPQRVQSLGSGFVIDGDEGIIVTNNHVIEGADEITVNFNDGTKLSAELLGSDEKTDLAVLKVEPQSTLDSVKFGSSEVLRVGDWVMAIGNPFGLGGTVTAGIVSARNRDINSGPYDNFIQTDAAINRGNSGGPLFNMDGEVVGINTVIFSPSGGSIGIGFAIPAETATRVIAQLREFGETRRGWLGVRIQHVTDEIAESLGMDNAQGALIAGVSEDGPAKEAGIMPGDVVLTFDGREVPEMRDLPRMVATTTIGSTVPLTVLRRGEEVEIEVTLGRLDEVAEVEQVEEEQESPKDKADETVVLGLSLAKIDEPLRERFALSDEIEGVVITRVAEGSSAEDKRVRAGDVIVEVAQEPVASPKDVVDMVEALKADKRRSALLLLSNGAGELRFVAVRIEE
ncbi:Trypsin-like serine protease [Pseudovibrio sp. FO-BEG1]|uniref:Probable periplasmic serine endoprotease DegP-like n=1 Tax=Pseudovibrio denitrificans TaxID=258256 RepID=A0A1I6ZIB4_9HYPH|nr:MULTISPECIES: DegQ family serine endoprotease [Pseudovibrio]AEV38732.1 Trypsin-like serine protease [Pseudovibrio sp. FO-BEG1]EEA95688.1 protease DO [Pseudovibrio sp. JE062]SFT62439.1 serine protease Do [Pseudovibrio denitrificans]